MSSWVDAPGGGVVAWFSAWDPVLDCESGGDLELYLHAESRTAAAKRARRLGVHGVRWVGKGAWISDEDVSAVLSSDARAVWRRNTDESGWYRSIEEWPLKQE